ncbi:MAG: hypothetical protein H7257_03030 [Taibaiella sp.]|nr:hypothetical protein [Taibaiella sp.]
MQKKENIYLNSSCYKQIFFIIIIFSGCLTAGTHGSIRSYKFPATKYELQRAVENVFAKKNNIYEDTIAHYIIDITNGKSDTIFSDYYNDGNRYVTLNIEFGSEKNNYVFQYSGDKEYWDTSKISFISVAYAYDKKGSGGSAAKGDFTWYNPSLKKKLIQVFESEFINELDKELGKKHID